jgi:hypothetical protein
MSLQFGHAYHLIDTPARIKERLADILETSNRVVSVTQDQETHQEIRILDQEDFDVFLKQADVLGPEAEMPPSLEMIRLHANDRGQQFQLYGDLEAINWGNGLTDKLGEGEGFVSKFMRFFSTLENRGTDTQNRPVQNR